MNYHVDNEITLETKTKISSQIAKWLKELELIEKAICAFLSTDNMQGKTANSIKSYLIEVHISLVESIRELLIELNDKLILYSDGYFDIDSEYYAQMKKTEFNELSSAISKQGEFFSNNSDNIESIIKSFRDLLQLPLPDKDDVNCEYLNLVNNIKEMDETIEEYEEAHKNDTDNIEMLMSNIRSIFSQRENGKITMLSYSPFSIMENKNYQNILVGLKAGVDFHSNHIDEISESEARLNECWEIKLADDQASLEEGFKIVISGLVTVIIAGVAIVGTGGLATPLVVAAGLSFIYGGTLMVEGGNSIYLGATGDGHEKPFNPLRDTVFASCPEAYYVVGEISTLATCFAVPVGSAIGKATISSTSKFRAGIIAGGNTLLTMAGAGAASWATEHFTGSEVLSLIVGLSFGFLGGRGFKSFEMKTNSSGVQTRYIRNTNYYENFKNGEGKHAIIEGKEYTLEDISKLSLKQRRLLIAKPSLIERLSNKPILNRFIKREPNTNKQLRFPPDDGFTHEIKGFPDKLYPNTKLVRNGMEGGKYVSPVSESVDSRSLPSHYNPNADYEYIVKKPFYVKSGKAAAYYGKPGGGMQYKLQNSVKNLVREGKLKRVKAGGLNIKDEQIIIHSVEGERAYKLFEEYILKRDTGN